MAFRHGASGVACSDAAPDEDPDLGEQRRPVGRFGLELAFDHDGDLAFELPVLEPGEDLLGAAPDHLLVELRQLTADRDASVPERGEDLSEKRVRPPRRLEEHDGPWIVPERLHPSGAIAGTPREEPLEHEPIRREPGQDEGGDRGRRAGDHAHVDAAIHGELHHPIAGIGDARHAPVRDDRDVVAGFQALDELDGSIGLVPLEHRHEGLADVEASQEAAGAPSVLGCDESDRRQRLASPAREVAEVADRRADEEEDAAHGPMVPRSPPPTMVRMAQPHKDYSSTPLPKKLGIREGARIYVAGAPEGFDAVFGPLPTGVERLGRPGSDMDVVLLFVTRERDLRSRFAKLAAALEPAGRLWVAWPKKASGVASDLDFDTVQRIGLDAGLVDNKSASVTEEFQALQFVYRLKDRSR